MAEGKPRLARLSAILTHLQSKKIVTARAIAEKHQVSIRTVYRDIRTLEKSGIPIVTEEGKGYSLMEGYNLPPVMFTEEEAMALITAEKLILKNKDQSLIKYYENAVTKIKSVLKHNQKNKTEFIADRIQVRNNPNNEKTSNYLVELQSTIVNFQVVSLDYTSVDNHQSQRLIEPFALYTTKDNWILLAYCRSKSDFRAFRLDRIQRLQETSDVFEPHKMTLEQYLEECRKKWQTTPDTPLSHDNFTFAPNQKNIVMQNVKIEPFKLIGLAIRTTNENAQAAKDIGELWGKFMSENTMNIIPNKLNNTVYSLYTDYEKDHNKPYTTVLGCAVETLDEIPEGMVGRTFEGGSYKKITTKGDLTTGLIAEEWYKIWELDLNRRYTADFEVYGEKSMNPKDAEVDILIAVD